MRTLKSTSLLVTCMLLVACGGSDQQSSSQMPNVIQLLSGGLAPLPGPTSSPGVINSSTNNNPVIDDQINVHDQRLSELLAQQHITGDPTTGLALPKIDDPLAQLGMKLFYTKSLGGEMDSACVSCHHPSLGGTDRLSLGVGVGALQPDLLGPGRKHLSGEFTVPRNAPTTFNSALYRRSLFWDSRVSLLDGGIRTPESQWAIPDQMAGDTLLEAQARFPITSAEEMRTHQFEHGSPNATVRNHLAARLGGYDGGFNAQTELATNNWLPEFQTVFGSTQAAEDLITYDNIAVALASYEASQVFVNSPWKRYVDGDNNAISVEAKRGAILFFTDKSNGGAHCSACHSGDLFSDELQHLVAFPQIGPGKGNGATGDDDFGFERETGNRHDRYRFRTPSLLNISMTAPYGHAGAYQTLEQVVGHYAEPQNAQSFFDNTNWCRRVSSNSTKTCEQLFPNAKANSSNAFTEIENQSIDEESIVGISLDANQIGQIVEFLNALTDPCTQQRDCLAPWIPAASAGPDGHQLNGVDQFGKRL